MNITRKSYSISLLREADKKLQLVLLKNPDMKRSEVISRLLHGGIDDQGNFLV